MKNFSLKALGATFIAAALVVFGASLPASATAAASATISVQSFTANSTVATDVTLGFSDPSPTGTSTYVQISLVTLALPNGCSTSLSSCGISSITVNSTTYTSASPGATTISKINPGIFQVILPSATTINTMSIVFAANQLTVGSTVGNASISWQAVSGGSAVAQSAYTVIANSGGGGGGGMVNFTGTGTLVDANTNPISTFAASGLVPGFTATATGFSNSATYSKVGVMFYQANPTAYFTLANAVSTISTPGAWSPNACGVTAIAIGGVVQSGSSGIQCQKETWSFNGATGYAIRLFFPSENSSALSVSVADNVFTSGVAGTYSMRLSMTSAISNGSFFSGGTSVPVTVGGSGSNSQSTPAPSTSLTLGATQGQLIAGSSVGISASGLQSTASYTVVVQSTPQTLASGNAVNGAVSTSVTLPSGLEPGWHTLTFTSTAADGSTVTSVVYFEVSASGTLLSSTTTLPAALAYTGFNAVPYLASGVLLALAGVVLMLFARRRQTR